MGCHAQEIVFKLTSASGLDDLGGIMLKAAAISGAALPSRDFPHSNVVGIMTKAAGTCHESVIRDARFLFRSGEISLPMANSKRFSASKSVCWASQ